MAKMTRRKAKQAPEVQQGDPEVTLAFPPGAMVRHISDGEDEPPGVILSIIIHNDGSQDYVVEWGRSEVGNYKSTMLVPVKTWEREGDE